MQRLCHRCQYVVEFEDESTLVFCNHCGAPQVIISEDLLEQARVTMAATAAREGDRTETDTERASRIAAQPPDLLVVWKSVIRISTAVCGVISLACLAFDPIMIFAWLAPGIVLGIYCARHRETSITAAVGARIGLTCGILCAFGITLTETAELLVRRFGMHQGGALDALLMQSILQARARAVAQSGEAASATFFNYLIQVPEYRVGFYLLAVLLGCSVLLALSTVSGAFSGLMRSRKPTR